jgi:hypothetical protein
VIDIECDNCEKTFSVDDADAGQKVPCPHCGDVNRVPAAEPAAEPAPAAREPAPEAAPTDELGERELTVVRPAMFRAHPFRYLFILVLFVGGLALAIASQISETVWPWLLWPAVFVVAMSLGWFAHWWISAHWWMKLIISNKRSVRHEGIVRRHTTEVLHDHVRSVDIQQNFVQRVMSVGSLGIDSAGQEDIEIQVRDIPRPYEVKKLIDRYRKM